MKISLLHVLWIDLNILFVAKVAHSFDPLKADAGSLEETLGQTA